MITFENVRFSVVDYEVKARGSSSSVAVAMATLDVLSEAASLSDVVDTILVSLDFILVDLIYKRSSFEVHLRPIHTQRKRKQKRKISLMFELN